MQLRFPALGGLRDCHTQSMLEPHRSTITFRPWHLFGQAPTPFSATECYCLSPTLTTYKLISATSTRRSRHLYKAAQNLASQMNLNRRRQRNCNEHYFAYWGNGMFLI